jgi:pyridoxal phosphate enzyme (YggS family)
VTDAPAVPDTGIGGRLDRVHRQITGAALRAGRDPASVRLIAVTKTVPAAEICEAAAAGVTDIGENRVQEARAKYAAIPFGVRWHLLGHLQANKANLAATFFDSVQTLDSEPIGAALSRRRDPALPPLSLLAEVDFTGIPGRTGLPPEQAEAVVAAVAPLPGIRLEGLMTVAPYGAPAAARDCFRRLRELRDRLQERLGIALPELSMGMTDDFEIAIAEGATMVRIGRALFGERPAGADAATPSQRGSLL